MNLLGVILVVLTIFSITSCQNSTKEGNSDDGDYPYECERTNSGTYATTVSRNTCSDCPYNMYELNAFRPKEGCTIYYSRKGYFLKSVLGILSIFAPAKYRISFQ